MTGTILSKRNTFKNSPKEPEWQAIPIMIVYTILVICVGFATTAVNLTAFGVKIYKILKSRKDRQLKNAKIAWFEHLVD